MVKNEYGISMIEISAEAKSYCPLGHDWYTNHFKISFFPDQFIPDYCEVDDWIKQNINGQELIIEAAVDKLHRHLCEKYDPVECVIESFVDDAAHSTVTVHK